MWGVKIIKCKNCSGELRIIDEGKAVCQKCGTKHMKLVSDEWCMVGDDKPFF